MNEQDYQRPGWVSEMWPDGSTLDTTFLLYIILAAVLVGGCAALWWLGRRLKTSSQPMRIFLATGGQLGLTVADCLLLRRIADKQGLESPLTLLMSQATFSHHTQRFTAQFQPRRAQSLTAQLDSIRRRLFDVGA